MVRFYSKRLTPLSVMCHYINRVEEDTPFIVMEYSAYLQNHVGQLADFLPPNIAFLTNIYDTHVNPGMFENQQQIFESKMRIKPSDSIGYINNKVVEELDVPKPYGWGGFDVSLPEGLVNPLLPPILRTAEMYTVGKLLARELNLSDSTLDFTYESYRPAENRIISVAYRGKDLFFHGETSGGSRLWSWFETLNGDTPWFMVETIDFADEDPRGFQNTLEQVFSSDKTYVLDTHLNRARLPVKASFVSENEFRDLLRERVSGYAVYHKALATRQIGFNPGDYLNEKW